MSFKTLLTHIDPSENSALDDSFATPFMLAEAHSASLSALVFPIEMEAADTNSGSRTPASEEESTIHQLRIAAERRGINCTIKGRSSFAYGCGEIFADHLRVSDLGIFTQHANRGIGQRILLSSAIFDTGRPVLIVPHGKPLLAPPSRVLVAWDSTPAAVRAVHGALPLIRNAKETLVVSITDDKELRHGQSGIEMAHLLARHGAKARFSAVQREHRSVLETILATAEDNQADLVVLGAVRHSPLHSIIFGSATQEMMDRGVRAATLVSA